MEFSPQNPVVKCCLQGNPQAAWEQASNDHEKFIAAHFLAQQQHAPAHKLPWLETGLQLAKALNDNRVQSALPRLYDELASTYTALGDTDKAQHYQALAEGFEETVVDAGPFFHGTKADLQPGEALTPGGLSNYQADLKMNHIYFTALASGAGLAAAMAQGDGPERVYLVEPTGPYENDPNVTNQKFPGNPTRSYRSSLPLTVLGEVRDWQKQSPEELQAWRERLAKSTGEIIN